MKKTLFVSALAVLSVISTASAQGFPTSYGNSSVTITVPTPTAASTTTERTYAQGRTDVVREQHRARNSTRH